MPWTNFCGVSLRFDSTGLIRIVTADVAVVEEAEEAAGEEDAVVVAAAAVEDAAEA